MATSDLTIILPAYNEEESIAQAVTEVHEHNPDAKILVVNDGSTDKTAEILEKLKGTMHITVVSHEKNRGYGAAVKTGFSTASTPYVGWQDTDLTYDPAHIQVLFKLVRREKLDCAWSNRLDGRESKMRLVHRVGNRALVFLFWGVTGVNIGDCTTGQWVISKKALTKVDYRTLPEGFSFVPALSKRVVTRHLGFTTVSTDYHERVGSSKLRVVKDFFRMVAAVAFDK